MRSRLCALVCVFALAPWGAAVSDIVNPARLELSETEPGVFDVVFTLPVVNGRRVKATPFLPGVCTDVTERQTVFTPASYEETWTMACEADALHGETIEVVGLLGTPVDVMLLINTLDGRSYSAILKPAKSIYVVPEAPSSAGLVRTGVLAGARDVLRRPEWWLLLLVLAFKAFGGSAFLLGLFACVAGCAVGQGLATRNWLMIPEWVAPVVVLLVAGVSAFDVARGDGRVKAGWLFPLWVTLLLVGLLLGGGARGTVPAQGLSFGEQRVAFVAFVIGTALALLLLRGIGRQVYRLLVPRGRRGGAPGGMRFAGYVGGATAWGLLFYRLLQLLWIPGAVSSLPLTLLLVAAVSGAWPRGGAWALAGFALLSGLGLALAHTGAAVPFISLLALGSLFGLALNVARGKGASARGLALVGVTVLIHGFDSGRGILSDLSLPIANCVGAGVLSVTVFHLACFRAAEEKAPGTGRVARVLAGSVAFLAVAWRVAEYGVWLDERVATELALGFLRVPLLSLALLLAALVAWPRRGKVLRELGVARRSPALALSLLCLSFFLLPHGSVRVRNPWYEPHAPEEQAARRILAGILSNTYHAFNEEDEDALYDQLSQSVSEDLVEDIYLDSRRRLTAGTRQGAQVTVKDVSVMSVGDMVGTGAGGEGFSYECKWIVTARVQHMQHVHHRQNIYNGLLTIEAQEDRWSLVNITLTSEERVVIPWRAG